MLIITEKYDKFKIWHRRMAHLNAADLQTLFRRGFIKDSANNNFEFCKSCVVGKQTRLPHSKK